MGTGNLTDRSAAQTVLHTHVNEIHQVLEEAFVGRNSSGVPTEGKDLGTSLYPWGRAYVDDLILDGTSVDLSTILNATPYKILSGDLDAVNMPNFLSPAGSGGGRSLTIEASTADPLELEINGEVISITSDIVLSSLTAAPSSNNTATWASAAPTGGTTEDMRLMGEHGWGVNSVTDSDRSYIEMSSTGSEISALIGKRAAFKVVSGGNTEYFTAYVQSSTILSDLKRGWFFSGTDHRPFIRRAATSGDTITLLKMGWIFVDSDGTTAEATYTEPAYSGTQPTGAASGDYWYDLVNLLWKRYNGTSFVEAERIFIGIFASDQTDTIAYRCADIYANYSSLNTIAVKYFSASQIISTSSQARINVAGNVLDFVNRITWDMASHIAAVDYAYNTTEQASTFYYLYITDTGNQKISDMHPTWRADFQGWYHPHAPWRCVGSVFNNGSSNLETASVDAQFSFGPKAICKRELQGNYAASATDSGTTTSTSYVTTNIDLLTVNIRTHGRPILVSLQPDGNTAAMNFEKSTAGKAFIKILRDSGTPNWIWEINTGATYTNPFMIIDYDCPVGWHTYTVQFKGDDGNTLSIDEARLVVVEL